MLLAIGIPAAALAAASLSPSPRTVNFGLRCVRDASPGKLVTVENEGDVEATDVRVELRPDEARDVFRVGGQLERERVEPQKVLRFRVGFTPPRAGEVQGEAVIRYNSPRPSSSATPSPSPAPRSTVVELKGSGLDRFIATSPRALDFGRLKMKRSEARTVRVFDDGVTPLTLFSASIAGRHAADFRIIDQPSRTVTEDDPTSLRVLFKPTRSGARTADLVLRSNSCDDATLVVPLAGLAVEPIIRVEPERYDFGVLKLNDTKRKRVTITNDGEEPLRISDITLEADTEGVFRVDGYPSSFPLTLRPHRSKTLSVFFKGAKAGPVSARLTIVSNDRDDRILNVPIDAAAIAPPPPPTPSSSPAVAAPGRGFSISFDRYAPELAVIAAVSMFFGMLLLVRRWKGIPE